ncbi:MAG: hypothetical protein ACR2PG_16425 [Hyphomicrobiaceae bacterium]
MTERDTSALPVPDPWNIGFGLALCVFALVALFIWFPRDIIGSFIETNQVGKVGPGDAFFPVLLASAILGLSAVHLLSTLLRRRTGVDTATSIGKLTTANVWFLVRFHLVVLFGVLTMFALGPIVVSAINVIHGSDLQYKALVDTVPYKYVGYAVGGSLLALPLIAWAEGGLRLRSIIIVCAMIVVSILIFDVLLNNVQLPPNADY